MNQRTYETTDLETTDAKRFQLQGGEMLVTTPGIGKELCRVLNAPPNTRTLTITIPTDDLLIVHYEAALTREQARGLGDVFVTLGGSLDAKTA